MSPLLVLVWAAAPLATEAVAAQRAATRAQANPIRKVVSMLQAMQSKVEKEGEAEKELYEKFMCYCNTGGGELAASIEEAESKSPTLTADIEGSEGKLSQRKGELSKAQKDRTAAEDVMAEAEEIRKKEAAAYATEKTEYEANIEATNKAIAAIESGMAGSFLQTDAAEVLRQLVQDGPVVLEADRQELVSFLSRSGYAPQSGEITGILKTMGDTMAKSLADATTAEEEAIKTYEQVVKSKTKEVKVLSAAIETKTEQIGELGVKLVQMKEDLSDTQATLTEDKKFLAELEKNCKTKTAEWEERSKTRAEELVALGDTIKVLNDDDALELFKKTLPSASASFMQVDVSLVSMRRQALSVLRRARQASGKRRHVGLDFLVLVLSGKKALTQGSFDKVIKMCDDMVKVLKKEQQDDDNKKEYCAKQFDLTDDKRKTLERTVSDTDNAIADAEEDIGTLTEEMKELEEGIVALDKSVAEATDQRQKENKEYKELMSSNKATKELLAFAKKRLNKFYNPKQAAAAAAMFMQVAARENQEGPGGPPPETWDAYQKKSGESSGVISLIDLLIKEMDKEMTEAETEEQDAQKDYEDMMASSGEKRTVDSKALAEKGGAKADLEAAVEGHTEVKVDTTKELMATVKYIQSLHNECDFLLKYFDVRKEARTDEIDALNKAKGVLSGADYSLLQTRSRSVLRRLR